MGDMNERPALASRRSEPIELWLVGDYDTPEKVADLLMACGLPPSPFPPRDEEDDS